MLRAQTRKDAMLRPIAVVLALTFTVCTGTAGAQTPPGDSSGTVTQSTSIANPATSVIGWFQAVSGNDPAAQTDAFALREAELGFQAAVDPYTRADFFLSAGPE